MDCQQGCDPRRFQRTSFQLDFRESSCKWPDTPEHPNYAERQLSRSVPGLRFKLKIIQVVTWYDEVMSFGGPTRVALNQCNALARMGHDVTLYAAGARSQTLILPSGAKVQIFKGSRIGSSFSSVVSLKLLLHIFKLNTAEILWHLHLARDLTTALVAFYLALKKRKYVLQTHGMLKASKSIKVKLFDSLLAKRIVSGSAQTLFLTEAEAEGLKITFGENIRLRQLNNGVPEGQARSRYEHLPTVVFISRLHSRKNPILFLDAAKVFLENNQARFIVAGPDEGEGRNLANWLERNSDERILVVGPVGANDVSDLLGQSSLLALPSVDEPFPMIVLEALSIGVPVVISDSCGLRDYVRENEAGLVIEPTASNLAKAFLVALDPPRNLHMSRNARKLARSVFSMEAIAEALCSIYAEARVS